MPARLTPKALLATGLILAVSVPLALATATHDEYVAKVNPICKSAARQAKKIPSRVGNSGRPLIDALRRANAYAKLLNKTIHRIANVQPAPGEAAQVKAWLDSDRRTVRLIRRFLRAAKHGDFAKARALIPKIVRSQRTNRKRAANLGLPACSKAVQNPT
jgi:hypothetical protein